MTQRAHLTLLLLAAAIPLSASAQTASPVSNEKAKAVEEVKIVLQHLKEALRPGVKAEVFQKLRNEPWFKENCEVSILHAFAGMLDFELRPNATLAYIDVIPGEQGSLCVFFQVAGSVDERELRMGSSRLKDLVITDVSFPLE